MVDAMKVSEYVMESTRPKLTDALVVNESCLILPDVEIPYQHAKFINKCVSLAKTWNIHHLILAGDALHWAAFSFFFGENKDADKEISEAEEPLMQLIQSFDSTTWFSGNHDIRPQRMMDTVVSNEKMMRLVVSPEFALEFSQRVKVSDYFHCTVGNIKDDNRWQIEHPKAGTVIPANAAKLLAGKYNCHVAMAHNHLVGLQQTQDGRHFGVEIGCCVDPERLDYVQKRHTTRPMMKNGALILRKVGEQFLPTLLSPEWTDWDLEEMRWGNRNESALVTQSEINSRYPTSWVTQKLREKYANDSE
jgi:hypothetical protein